MPSIQLLPLPLGSAPEYVVIAENVAHRSPRCMLVATSPWPTSMGPSPASSIGRCNHHGVSRRIYSTWSIMEGSGPQYSSLDACPTGEVGDLGDGDVGGGGGTAHGSQTWSNVASTPVLAGPMICLSRSPLSTPGYNRRHLKLRQDFPQRAYTNLPAKPNDPTGPLLPWPLFR